MQGCVRSTQYILLSAPLVLNRGVQDRRLLCYTSNCPRALWHISLPYLWWLWVRDVRLAELDESLRALKAPEEAARARRAGCVRDISQKRLEGLQAIEGVLRPVSIKGSEGLS